MKNKTFCQCCFGVLLLGIGACQNEPITGETNPNSTKGGAGGSGLGSGGTTTSIEPEPTLGSTFTLGANPERKLDLLFVIDNSMSMLPKQKKLADQFSKLIQKLADDENSRSMLDLHIAIVNTDLGTGISGRCPRQYGDKGVFQIPKGTECGVNPGATFLEYKKGKNVNFAVDEDVARVFSCVATAVGSEGCGFEQPLQALNWALNMSENEAQKKAFIRDDAYLGIVILTDEDDCSTEPTSLLAAEDKITLNESWSLRCATRGHQCGGAKLSYPTTASFETDFFTCKAREDYCDPKESGQNPTSCTPLANIQSIADSLKNVKGNDLEKIFIAAIIGWPMEGQSSATYTIALAPNPNAGQPDKYDYFPVCYDPDHPMPADGAADRPAFDIAFGWGGYGGLRIKAFLDEFPVANTQINSICERDYSSILENLGAKLDYRLSGRCLPKGYMQGSAWEIFLRVPAESTYIETPLAECTADTSAYCYQIQNESGRCSGSGLMFNLQVPAGSAPLPVGSQIRFQRS
jgi:hypothetical protein